MAGLAADAARALTGLWWQPRPTVATRLLQPLSWLYATLAALDAARFRLGLARVQRLPVPVVVVGNLIAGGAGKTPTVMALLHELQRAGWTPGVVSRGHGRRGRGLHEVAAEDPPSLAGDEPALIRRRTGVPVVVGADRPAAARRLLQRHPQVDVLVSDDGLQHHRLGRDVQIIVFDERGIGNGLRLPAGPLRSALGPRPPPGSLVLYNAPAPSTAWPGALAGRTLAGAVPLADWQRGERASAAALAALRGRPLRAVAGIASPERFFGMLRAAGLQIDDHPLPDHDPFDALPWPPGTPDVLLTEKDAVKLAGRDLGGTRVWVVPLDFQFDAAFLADLHRLLPRRTR